MRHHERESIRHINKTFGLSLRGPWREPLARVGGRAYTLDAIEHDIIRTEFRELRIHFALVCAALGCPPLRSEAYRGDLLAAQLDDQARVFLLASPNKNRVDTAAHRVILSPIFDWYRDDFGTSRVGVAAFVARFFPPGAARTLLDGEQFDLETVAQLERHPCSQSSEPEQLVGIASRILSQGWACTITSRFQ